MQIIFLYDFIFMQLNNRFIVVMQILVTVKRMQKHEIEKN